MLNENALANLIDDENKRIPDLGQTTQTTAPFPTFAALPAPAAASVEVPKNPSKGETQGETDSTGSSTVTSYEISEIEDLIEMPAEDEARLLSC